MQNERLVSLQEDFKRERMFGAMDFLGKFFYGCEELGMGNFKLIDLWGFQKPTSREVAGLIVRENGPSFGISNTEGISVESFKLIKDSVINNKEINLVGMRGYILIPGAVIHTRMIFDFDSIKLEMDTSLKEGTKSDEVRGLIREINEGVGKTMKNLIDINGNGFMECPSITPRVLNGTCSKFKLNF